MNSIYKTKNGKHIDISKIVGMEPPYRLCGEWLLCADVQLMDKPVLVMHASDSFSNSYMNEVYEDLLKAWKAFNGQAD